MTWESAPRAVKRALPASAEVPLPAMADAVRALPDVAPSTRITPVMVRPKPSSVVLLRMSLAISTAVS